jgi:hypothetical protein
VIEIILAIGLCVVMGKIADADGRSGFLWGGITAALCVACLFIPIPYARFLLAGVVAFVAMIVVKMIRK